MLNKTYFINSTINQLSCIALDPAGPLFYQFGADHIDMKSAAQVDVIHTDGGFFGALRATGTADFFANGGNRPQPGCPLISLTNPLSSDSN